MELTLLIQSVMGLLVILGLLVFILVLTPKPSPKPEYKEKKVKKPTELLQEKNIKTDLESLRAVVKSKKSTTKELQEALELVIKYHGTIHKKLGIRAHPESDIYMDIIFNICRHPNANKDIVVKFDKDLGILNPEYKKEMHDAMTRGLNSRGL